MGICRIIGFVGRFVLAALFLYAGWMKITAPEAFTDSIHSFGLLPPILINVTAMVLPVLEIVIGLLLLAGLAEKDALILAMGLCVLFLLAFVQAAARSIDVDCGCFGAGSESLGDPIRGIVRNGALLILATCRYWVRFRRPPVTG